ncbi:S-adenosyl-L-methionine-dependent methyltransferase [Peziza echinospora]|nr:S-adenosyl-L-methionine-dependent methyltransferase [Peziza echinospora]
MSCCTKPFQPPASIGISPNLTSSAPCPDDEKAYNFVQSHYTNHALSSTATTGNAASATYNEQVATAFGYTKEDLESIPTDANLGVSCGNPLALAALKEGEVLIDLGCGAGFDVFLASKKVGETGRAIGVDMTDAMLALCDKNAAKGGYTNTTFIKAFIHNIPLPENTADCIISNCVINLVPDSQKLLVFKECYRLLKPGGRLAVSDILAKKELLKEIREDAMMKAGCIGGASLVGQYEAWLNEAGFQDIILWDTNKDLNIYKDGIMNENCCSKQSGGEDTDRITTSEAECCGETTSPQGIKIKAGKAEVMDYDLNEWTGSYQVYAIKPTV